MSASPEGENENSFDQFRVEGVADLGGGFEDVSKLFLDSYSELIGQGFPPGLIALSMLRGTLIIYERFNLNEALPDLLRAVAENMERDGQLS